MSQTVILLDAVVIKDVSYPSGNIALNLGDHVQVVRNGSLFFVYDPKRRSYTEACRNDFAYSTDSEDWVREHLVLEGF
jgi:hypothetical protein